MEQHSKKYNILRIVTVVQSALILIAVVVICFSGILNNKQEYLLAQSKSDNGEYSIEIFEVGSPNIFRSNTVKAYYSDSQHKHETAVFTAEVNNGDQPLGKNNFTLTWEGDTAVLYLVGSEQTGTAYKINFDTATKK